MKSPKILQLLNKINRAIENPAFPEVSKIERDLLLQHVRDLYEALDNPLQENTVQTKHETAIAETLRKRPVIMPNDSLLIKEQPAIQQPVEQKIESPVIKQQPVITTIDTPVVRQTPATTSIEPPGEMEVENKPETVFETKAEKKIAQSATGTINESIKAISSLNEKLKTSSTTEMHKKLATKPLRELIDFNKKFVLLNELFKGDVSAYLAAIAYIDALPDYDAAQAFIAKELVPNFAWDDTKQSTRMFAKLIRLKFGVE